MTRVIKAGVGTVRVIPSAVVDAKADARRILTDAERLAAEAIQAASVEAARIREEAQRSGFARGQAEAAATLLEAARVRDQALANAEMEAVKVALAAVTRILDAELATDPDKIRHIVAANLDRARRAKKVTIHVNPDDLAALGALPVHARVEPDADLTRGGCIIRSELGTVDARIETQLAALAEALQIPWP